MPRTRDIIIKILTETLKNRYLNSKLDNKVLLRFWLCYEVKVYF